MSGEPRCRLSGLSKQQKAAVRNYDDLLELKATITTSIRELGETDGWPGRFGAHMKRAQEGDPREQDPREPSSLIVWTFDIGRDKSCSPAAFTLEITLVIEGTAPLIDEFLVQRCAFDFESAAKPMPFVATYRQG